MDQRTRLLGNSSRYFDRMIAELTIDGPGRVRRGVTQNKCGGQKYLQEYEEGGGILVGGRGEGKNGFTGDWRWKEVNAVVLNVGLVDRTATTISNSPLVR